VKGWYTVTAESPPVLPVSNADELNSLVQQYWSYVVAADQALASAWRSQLIQRYGAANIGSTGAQVIFFPDDPSKIKKVGAIMTVNFMNEVGALPGDLITPAQNALTTVANSLPYGAMLSPWTIIVSGESGGGDGGGGGGGGGNGGGTPPIIIDHFIDPTKLLPLLLIPVGLIFLFLLLPRRRRA
jgi:uncharacterized membrane protein YgcG